MTIEWGDYEMYDPGVAGEPANLARADARRAFAKLMEERPLRVQGLSELLQRNGRTLESSDEGVQALDDWFRANVEEDPEMSGRLSPEWYSVVTDIGLFLGDVMIERHPQLRWDLFTAGKKNASYQRPVVMGFTRGGDPNMEIDVAWQVAGHGHRKVRGLSVKDDKFLRLLRMADEMA